MEHDIKVTDEDINYIKDVYDGIGQGVKRRQDLEMHVEKVSSRRHSYH